MKQYLLERLIEYKRLEYDSQLMKLYMCLQQDLLYDEKGLIFNFIISLSEQNKALTDALVNIHNCSLFPTSTMNIKEEECQK